MDSDSINITVLRDNIPPHAFITCPESVTIPARVVFDGSGSSDNVAVVNYTWNIVDPEGTRGEYYGARITLDITIPGYWNITLSVRDARDNSNTARVRMAAKENDPPMVEVPREVNATIGEEVVIEAHARDASGIGGYEWSFYDNGQRVIEGSVFRYAFSEEGDYTIYLRVSDIWGNEATATVVVHVSLPPERAYNITLGPFWDTLGNIASGATVSLLRNGNIIAYGLVNPHGFVFLSDVAPGNYTLVIIYRNITTTVPLSVGNDGSVNCTIPLLEVPHEYTITIGPVVDTSGEPVFGASVEVEVNGITLRGKTNSSGYVTFDVAFSPSGLRVHVYVSADGYLPYQGDMKLSSRGESDSIVLEKAGGGERTEKASQVYADPTVIVFLLLMVVLLALAYALRRR